MSESSLDSARLLSGVDTLCELLVARRALDARDGLDTATFVSGYPGSPLGGFDLALGRLGERAAEHRIVHRPGLNEELAAAAVWGSQMGEAVPYEDVDGVVGAWYGKGPGLDRSGDVLKHANLMGSGPNEKAGFSADLTLNRKDYGIVWNRTLDAGGTVLGDDVYISINVEANPPKPPAPPATR